MKIGIWVMASAMMIWEGVCEAARVPNEILTEIEASLPEAETIETDEWEFARGGYVLRVDLDITGDGLPEMFVTTSSGMYRGSPVWRVYHARREGGYEPFVLGRLEKVDGVVREPTLSVDGRFGIYLRKNKGVFELGQPWHDRFTAEEEERWGVNYVSFRGNQVQFATEYLGEDWDGGSDKGELVQLEEMIQGVLIADLLRNPEAPWHPVRLSESAPNLLGSFLDPQDQSRVEKMGMFHPALAWEWLRAVREGRPPTQSVDEFDQSLEGLMVREGTPWETNRGDGLGKSKGMDWLLDQVFTAPKEVGLGVVALLSVSAAALFMRTRREVGAKP